MGLTLGIILIVCALAFYSWRLWVFANAFGKKQHTSLAKHHEEKQDEPTSSVKRYSIHKNIYE